LKQFVPVRLRVEKNAVTRITRALNGRGTLNVRVGQQISPEEIIGSSTISAGFRTINLSSLLSVAPAEVERLLVRKLNQRIYKGELLAQKKGWLGKKIVTAPTDGILDFLNNKTGELRITFMPKKVNLPAGVFGIVEAVDQERGQIIIRTEVCRIYGMLGSGHFREGILRILSRKDELISKSGVKPEYEGNILVGGSLYLKEAISTAISIGVSGIITGGIDAGDYRAVASGRLVFPKKIDNDVGISIVVCEGFGSIPIGMDIFETLQNFEGKFILIDGNKSSVILPSFLSSCMVKIKSTKLPDLPKTGFSDTDRTTIISELKIGLKVRVVGNSYFGEQGKLVAVNDSLSLLPSGIYDYLATVETARRKIQVPVANLEIIM